MIHAFWKDLLSFCYFQPHTTTHTSALTQHSLDPYMHRRNPMSIKTRNSSENTEFSMISHRILSPWS
ncbi:hypothetical protein BDV09DRAFT_167478 [Aspergillus tetrazonus]